MGPPPWSDPHDDFPDDDVGDPPDDSGSASSLGGGGSQPGGSPNPPPSPGLPGPEPPGDDEPPGPEEDEEKDEEEQKAERKAQGNRTSGTAGPTTGPPEALLPTYANRLDWLGSMAEAIVGSSSPGPGLTLARRTIRAAARALASRLQLVGSTAGEAERLGEELLARLKARTEAARAARATALAAYVGHARAVGVMAGTLLGRAEDLARRMEGK